MKKPRFVDNQIYHIYNRGVEKRTIFLDNQDYLRFVHDLFEFNDTKPAENLYYKREILQSYEVEPRKIGKRGMARFQRELLVDILIFCLMPNHFHLLLRQKRENGIIKFMQKLGTGYTMYFNQKYERVGTLFQGRFRAVLVAQEPHFVHLPYYIHLNPLDLIEPRWREGKIEDYQRVIEFLESYRWSSFLDYIGKKNFPSLTQRKFLLNLFKGEKEYKKETIRWLKEIDLEKIRSTILE